MAKKKDRPQNTEGLKRGSFHDNWGIPAEAYLKLLEFAMIELQKPEPVMEAYGIKFVDPLPLSDSLVAEHDYLVPCEIYNDNGNEDLILVNHVLKMNVNAAIMLQYFEGAIGKRYIRVPPNDWVRLPHRFYIGYLKSGRPPRIVRNMGNAQGVGIKNVLLS